MGSEQSFSSPTAHSRFAKVQYSSSNQNMLVRQPAINIKSINSWTEKRKLYRHIYNSPSLFNCKQYKIEPNGACGTTGMFLGIYNGAYIKTLKDEILRRYIENHFFTEEQIWYLILFVSKSASQIYQYGNNHFIGNIHPNNILINQKGDYKIIATNYSFSLPNQLDHFKEYQINGDSHAYISPQLIGFLYSTKYTGYPHYPKCISKQAAEAFSLGITIIAMATLNLSIVKIYKRFSLVQNSRRISRVTLNKSLKSKEKKNQNQKDDYLNELLQQIQERYSKILYELIVGLVHHEPQIRLHLDRVYRQLLVPIQNDITLLDKQWIQKLKNQPKDDLVDIDSKQICFNWARGQSYILKQQNHF